MKMKTLCAALSGAILLGAATLSLAADRMMSRSEYSAGKDRIEADYKAAKEKCKGMDGNAGDVCKKEAKADEKIRKADLEAKYRGTAESAYDARITRAKAQHDVAKQKCEGLSSKEKSGCKKQAKADEQKAIAEARSKKVASAPAGSK